MGKCLYIHSYTFPQQHEADTGILFKNLYFPPKFKREHLVLSLHNLFKPGEIRGRHSGEGFGKSLGSLGVLRNGSGIICFSLVN